MLVRIAIGLITVLALAAAGWLGKSWWDSRLPGTYSAMEFGRADFGGAPGQNHAVHPHVSVDQLKGPRSSKPDFRITLGRAQGRGHARLRPHDRGHSADQLTLR
jgi:hypothetical protein